MNDIIEKIKNTNNIVLLCHENPDGDAIGSVISMYQALKKLGKEVDVIVNDIPKRFSFIEGINDIKIESSKTYNLGIVLDTATIERVNSSFILANIAELIVIDHHLSNTKYGSINYIEDTMSCCEIVYKLIKKMNIPIDSSLAVPLITGILTDSGGFAYSKVTSNTFLIAAEISDIIDISDIYKRVLQTITKSQFELKKIYLSHLEFYEEDKIAFSYVTEEEINRVGATKDDCDILVNIAREIETVEVSLIIRAYNDINRISIRSLGDIDSNQIASSFGGGGHLNAAGAVSTMDFNKLKEKLIEETRKELHERNISSK